MTRTAPYAALIYAVRPAVVTKYLGQSSLILAGLALAPMAVGFYFGETAIAWHHLAVAMALAALLEISAKIKGDARVFSFIVHADDEKAVRDLGLPEASRIICLYRKGEFMLPEDDTVLRKDDEVILIAHRKHLPELVERWTPHNADEAGGNKP